MRQRKRPVRPPCPCGVKTARYRTRIGYRCSMHAGEQWGMETHGRAYVRATWAAWGWRPAC